MRIPNHLSIATVILLTGCAAQQPVSKPAATSTPAAVRSSAAVTVADPTTFKRSAEFNLAVIGEEKTCLCCRGPAAEAMAKVTLQLYDTKQIDTLRAMAGADVAHAQYTLAMAYYRGHGVARDPQQSTAWLKRAAEKGYGPAQFTLGYSYQQGDGVPRDESQAAQWFGRAAVKGFVRAQIALAECYRYGRGVPVDTTEARSWYTRIVEGANCEFAEEARIAIHEMH